MYLRHVMSLQLSGAKQLSYSTQNTAEFAKLYKPVCTFGRVRGDTVMCKQTQLCEICVKID